MMPALPHTSLSVLLCAAVLTLGCGSDDGDEPQSQATATPTPAQTGTATPTPEQTGTPTPEDEAQTRSCGQVAYTQNSDHGAFEIEATGVPCDVAREVARAARDESGSFSAAGFDCTGERDDEAALPSTEWQCSSDDAEIGFLTS